MAGKRRIRAVVRFLTRTRKDPESLARGLSLGVFVGFLPSIGFQMVLALMLAGAIGANRIAAAAGTFVTNPVTTVPFGLAAIWLGDWLLPGVQLPRISGESVSWRLLFDAPGTVGAAFLVGSLAMGFLGAGIAYLVTKFYYVTRPIRIRDGAGETALRGSYSAKTRESQASQEGMVL